MGHKTILVFAAVVGLLPATAPAELTVPRYEEPFRPGFHYTPEINWTNEPNGLIYHEGRYHIFYQANPFNNQFGNQSWGHATSTDMVHWEQQPVAIPAENGIFSFSGSAVYDENNSSGLGIGGNGPLIAAYTGFNPLNGVQDQRLAYSNDSGDTWTKYSGNPVLTDPVTPLEARDPKVFRYEADTSHPWRMITTHGGQKKVKFYKSDNLINWSPVLINGSQVSEFVDLSLSATEVPDMFQLPVDGNPANNKWVLSVTPDNNSPAGGNGVAYYVGDFDGTTYTPDGPFRWADFGRDFDGQQSWSNMPTGDDRVVWTSIMNSYGETPPTTPWRGQMAIPRELSLQTTVGGVKLFQQPIAELQSLRIPGAETILTNQVVGPGNDPLDALNLQHDMFEIKATFDPQSATFIGMNVRENGGEFTQMGYSTLGSQMFMGRANSGDTSFHPDAGGTHWAPMATAGNGDVVLHAFVDRGSVELFGNDGEAVISNLIFPDASSKGISLFANNTALVKSLEIYPLQSIWPQGTAPEPGGDVVAHWNMEPTPAAIGGDLNLNRPVTIDQRIANGEGTRVGNAFPLIEPDPAVDNLFIENNGFPNNGVFTTSTDVPPQDMFANGNDGGAASYDASAIVNNTGALYLSPDHYGSDVAFTGAFTVEMFFKTDGNQSGAGNMELLLQDPALRYGLIVNEGGPGNVRFAINDKAGHIPIVDISSVSSRNYADGEWHYLVATYDPATGSNGELSLTIVNEDGTFDVAISAIGTFFGLPASGDGTLYIGREKTSPAHQARTFLGLIDEVQLTGDLFDPSDLLGVLPSLADFNKDGSVNSNDLSIWDTNFGTPSGATMGMGDADMDGDVDLADLMFLQRVLGATGSPLAAAVPVPEPASSLMLALGACVIAGARAVWGQAT